MLNLTVYEVRHLCSVSNSLPTVQGIPGSILGSVVYAKILDSSAMFVREMLKITLHFKCKVSPFWFSTKVVAYDQQAARSIPGYILGFFSSGMYTIECVLFLYVVFGGGH
jgi:hypothetical protein